MVAVLVTESVVAIGARLKDLRGELFELENILKVMTSGRTSNE